MIHTALKKIFLTSATLAFVILMLSWLQIPKKENPYGLDIISSLPEYRSSIEGNCSNQLVDLEKTIRGVVLDMRYATANNFTGQPIYPAPKAFLRKMVADSLLKIQLELKKKGLGLKIFDAYRPYSVTLKFFKIYPDTNFVASPRSGSRHNRGCAVDLTILETNSGKELEMPTPFDDFTVKASQSYQNLPDRVLQNRKLLRDIMVRHGFEALESEWWHYDFRGWRNFKIMDIAFDELTY
jgi:D-alanyl-D-alanine dipeptidase